MLLTLDLTLPGRPFTTNEWDATSTGARMRLKAQWRDRAEAAARAAQLVRLAHAVVIFQPTYPDRRIPDAGNVSRCGKAVLDGLVHAGVLADDNPTFVHAELYLPGRVERGAEPSFTVRLIADVGILSAFDSRGGSVTGGAVA